MEFKAWPKTPRLKTNKILITEKLDGTNACVIVEDNQVVGVQSRKRLITPEDDNFGFASWVENNKEELSQLGDGYHYGEWVGPGIQKNPHQLEQKEFYLFNTFRPPETLPECVKNVPVLYQGVYSEEVIRMAMLLLKNGIEGVGKGRDTTPEGIIVYFYSSKIRMKETFANSEGKWKE